MIKIASFNLENLFTRPVAMNQDSDEAGRQAIEDHATANRIADQLAYSPEDKAKLLELTQRYGWHERDPPRDALVQLLKIRGRLFSTPANSQVEVAADGRADWVGWFELLREDVSWKATYNTARVINEVQPDILITVEVENRPTLERFNTQVLGAEFHFAYPHCMVVDGNDQRGIDLGIMSRFPINTIRSHVDDRAPNGNRLFSRDCPEYDIILPAGERIIIIPNHLKSKRNGNNEDTRDQRTAQALGAHMIARGALGRSPCVVLGGDMNDTPDSVPLASLFSEGFQDVMSHPSYPNDRPGTFQTGLANHKIDYLIMSPDLYARLLEAGIERRGSYHPRTWKAFDSVTSAVDEASDHHLIWANLDFAT